MKQGFTNIMDVNDKLVIYAFCFYLQHETLSSLYTYISFHRYNSRVIFQYRIFFVTHSHNFVLDLFNTHGGNYL